MRKFFLLLLLLCSCRIGPRYEPPTTSVTEDWQSEDTLYSDQTPETTWWETFDDPLLTDLIEKAATCNYDLQVAWLRVLEARAIRKIEAAPLYPQLDFNLTYTRNLLGGFGGQVDTDGLGVDNINIGENFFFFGFDAAWELDLWGRIRNIVDRETRRMWATCEARHDLLLTIFADVARNYFELRSFQEQILLVDKTVETLQKQLELVSLREKVGLDSRLQKERLRSDLASTKALRPPLEAAVKSTSYQLAILVGQLPDSLVEDLGDPKDLPELPDFVAVGVPCELLARRPDVRQAEQIFAASVYDVGAAIGDRFPRINLFGNLGGQTLNFGLVSENNAFAWGVGGNLLTPLIRGGEISANINRTKIISCQEYLNFQQAVLTAMKEVDEFIARYEKQRLATEDFAESAGHQGEVVTLSQDQYHRGVRDLIDLLNEQRLYYERQQEEITSKRDALLHLVSLYKALGGGWELY